MVTLPAKTHPEDADRFWACVDRRGPYEHWPYTGRGMFRTAGRQVTPATAAWELGAGRRVPPGEVVYRKCGFASCVNPRHLGTGERPSVAREIDRIAKMGPACRVEVMPAREQPVEVRKFETHFAPARVSPVPDGVCPFCSVSGKPGVAIVCGSEIDCPACKRAG